MKCKTCQEQGRPTKGASLPPYCDACGWAIMSNTGDRVRADALTEAVVALGEALAARPAKRCACFGAADGYHEDGCPTWQRQP
jgi:hypothetical protein